MNIGDRIRELGPVDSAALGEAVLAQESSAWHEQTYRQQEYDVHRQTESIVLVFANLEVWPQIEICKEPGWDRLSALAIPVMHDIIARHYPPGGTIIRAMAAKLLAGGKIAPHVDSHPSFHRGHRIHVPITTNPRVRFMIDGRPHRLQVGQAYEINNQMNHSVMNKGTADRITFIFDYVPPQELGRIQTAA
ncbi:MAG: aspartyl/asparaginyl beta-hydroxylase domain-containing protein [Xanthomonadales bacterium]|nr:aspartyl/asparaginyl beta-hydroxylase domain-containing protein [Xanthomonadales bacterium]